MARIVTNCLSWLAARRDSAIASLLRGQLGAAHERIEKLEEEKEKLGSEKRILELQVQLLATMNEANGARVRKLIQDLGGASALNTENVSQNA